MRTHHFQTDFSAAEFCARRAKVIAAMKNQGHALIAGAAEAPGFDPFRQNNDFYYLCGVEVPHAYLLIDAAQNYTTLFLQPRDEKHEKTDGPQLCADDGDFARERAGVDAVRALSELPAAVKACALLYMPLAPAENARMTWDTLKHYRAMIEADPLNGQASPESHLRAKIEALNPSVRIEDLSPHLQRMRIVKSPAEIELMRRAGRIAALAANAALDALKPGVFEYQLGAEADYVYQMHGSRAGGSYRPIIAGGANIAMMHYWRNNCALRDGDLVIFDYAPDLNNYTSDIGRMWPVNGVYSPLQRELYGFAVEHHQILLSLIAPGKLPEEILKEAAERMRPRWEAWAFSKEIYRAGAAKKLESNRPLSHGVGMPVHEPENYFGRPLEVGTVFAVDPEIVVPEEKLYFRCEDTVVVTETGCENLTSAAPLEMGDVERWMAARE